MCVYKKEIENKKYLPNKKNGYTYIKDIRDERLRITHAKCGKCYECRKEKQRDWTIRMLEEIKNDRRAEFWTLTIDDKHMKELKIAAKEKYDREDINDIARVAIRRFLERHRKMYKKSMKHWFITELGGEKGRIHLHGIIFEDTRQKDIEKLWKYGMVWKGQYVSERTIRYITKYMLKENEQDKKFVGIVLCSAGIGKTYITEDTMRRHKFNGKDTNISYKNSNGTEVILPTYYRRKIWNDDERELLNLINLDSKWTYVGGEKILKEDVKLISELTSYYQKKYKRITGDNEALWEKQKKERQRKYMLKRKKEFADSKK